MTSFNVHNDDAGLQIRPTPGRTVKEVQAYAGGHAVQGDENATEAPKQADRKERRRKRDRRHQKDAVLLDTRSGHDRRNASINESSETRNDTPEAGSTSGIDVYT